jgi:hypothetical protein
MHRVARRSTGFEHKQPMIEMDETCQLEGVH